MRLHLGIKVSIAAMSAAACVAIAVPQARAEVLHDQYAPLIGYVSSQNFEPTLDNYDSLGADDFVVPSGRVWRIDRVEVSGENGGASQATTANFFLFADAGTLPGALILTRSGLPLGPGHSYPEIDLPVSGLPVLSAGRYWVGVQANLAFDPGANNWFWHDHAPQVGQPAAWRQPGNGFGDGCTSFITRSSCPSYPGSAATPDQSFRLSGQVAQEAFKVVKAKVKRRGKVKLRLTAPDLGALASSSRRLKTATRNVTEIGSTSLVLRPTAGSLRRLVAGERVKAKISVTLKPAAGPPLVTRLKVRLKR